MKPIQTTLLKDAYKIGHPAQYKVGTNLVYSNFTPRKTRVAGIEGVIACGMQYFVLEYLVDQFNENFFWEPKTAIMAAYKRRVDNMLGPGTNIDHIGDLHDLGHLPLIVKVVPEGTLVPFRVPVLTIRNTHERFGWLTNMIETLMSNILWMPMTSATTAFMYRRVFEKYARQTGGAQAFIDWQGHDFSMRGLPGLEAACLSGFGHLLSFTGTDTVPAIDFAELYYGANSDTELVGGSVPATEHSVMCMGLQDNEEATFERLIGEVYKSGIVSIVSDTWDFWKVLTTYLPKMRSLVLGREGKVVIRPDSGDPVKIICGDPEAGTEAERKGAIQLLFEVFGGVRNPQGYVTLDSHIGLIYGDSITLERQTQILEGLKAKGFASDNVVLGIGSYTYQMVTRDTFGFAMKATYGEVNGVGQAIFKEPKTDDGTKNSAKGLLTVYQGSLGGHLIMKENVDWDEEERGILKPIFVDGRVFNLQTLAQIRALVRSQL